MTTGYAADVAEHVQADGKTMKWEPVASPSDRSSRFLSFVDWRDAYDSAYLTLEKQFKKQGVTMTTGPIVAKGGDAYPKASGYIEFLDIEDPSKVISRPLGEGYAGAKDGSEHAVVFRRPDGTTFTKSVYPTVVRVPRGTIRYVYTTMGWTGREWILINLYPSARPKATTPLGLIKKPDSGHSTILEGAP